ncbi:YybH family protein [Dyella subtropica]|uniref:YybH family protein n=1 Tax=Dyella subtropica TaxID=2992127 RepID=UPI0022520803|nr:nuclear transport factor 2 family protein [Dyella subtropica]
MSDFDSQIMQVLEGYKAAVLAKDVDAFIKLYDQDVRVFDAWGTWSYQGAAAWRQIVQQWFASLGEESVAVSMEDVHVTGAKDMAVISAMVTYAGISSTGERVRAMQNRLTWAMSRMGDSWGIVHEHTSAPIDFDDLKAILERN